MVNVKTYISQYESEGYWKCEDCGLTHKHHPIDSGHDIRSYISTNLDYNPICNCGIQESYKLYVREILNCTKDFEKLIEKESKYKLVPDNIERDIWKSVKKRF